ncbi:tetratricopeptide (TPR) repeat protein [Azospirillum agricola]|uniref:tetratricopeptide repeat protein n=1 Tax=Azospirillum agricola TaxID=1720247 RepID=UPI001F3705E9|nr:hypothetical protein [Azospirillum agricola]MBP2229630.1 tetratricopeptide (TPR) repeat protein [Azospirillum agricola]
MCSAYNRAFPLLRWALALLALLWVAAVPSLSVTMRAQTPPPAARLEAVRDEAGARFALRWPGRVATEIDRQGRDLTLRFSRPLGGVALESAGERLQGWVEGVQYGYDSVLLVLAPGVAAEAVPDGSGVAVAFTREPEALRATEAQAADRAADQAAQRRIDYFQALAFLEGGQLRQARSLLLDRIRVEPRDAQSTALLAQAEERLGRWREALRAYDVALKLTPNEPSLVRSKARLLRENGDRMRFDVDRQKVRGGETQHILKLAGVKDIGRSTSFVYGLESRFVDAKLAQRADGDQRSFHGSRQKLDLGLVRDWPELERSTLTLSAAQRTLGVGYTHAWRDEASETRAGIAWSEPNFAFLEGIVGGGRRDRVFLQHDERLSERWSLTLGAGYNRYGLSGAADLARSATVEGALRYVLNQEGPLASVAYTLDAEYVGRRVRRETAQGQPYVPLPAATREVHGIQVAAEDWLTDYVRYGVQVGYSYDRRGKSGPQGSFSVSWEPTDTLEVGIRASHARSTARGSASAVDMVGGYVILRC